MDNRTTNKKATTAYIESALQNTEKFLCSTSIEQLTLKPTPLSVPTNETNNPKYDNANIVWEKSTIAPNALPMHEDDREAKGRGCILI